MTNSKEQVCVKCGHSKWLTLRGTCKHLLVDTGHPSPNARWEELHCGCKCKFVERALPAQFGADFGGSYETVGALPEDKNTDLVDEGQNPSNVAG